MEKIKKIDVETFLHDEAWRFFRQFRPVFRGKSDKEKRNLNYKKIIHASKHAPKFVKIFQKSVH